MTDDQKDVSDVAYDFRLDFYEDEMVLHLDVYVEPDDDGVHRGADVSYDDVLHHDNGYKRICREEQHDTSSDDVSRPRNDSLRFRRYRRQHNRFRSHSTQHNRYQ